MHRLSWTVGLDRVALRFKRVYNWLNPFEVAPEALPFEAEDGQGLVRPSAYTTGRDVLELTFPRPLEDGDHRQIRLSQTAAKGLNKGGEPVQIGLRAVLVPLRLPL